VNKLVSVIIPVYNGETYIEQALNSVVSQTYTQTEIIVIDDGSTDNTVRLVKKFMALNSNINLLSQQRKGSAAARNLGFKYAKGTYYALIDADDTMFEERIEKQVNFLDNNPQIAVVSCLAYYVNEKHEIIGKNYSDLFTVEQCKNYLEQGKIIFCLQSGVMMRPEALWASGGYRDDLIYAQDIDLWNRMAEAGYYTVVMPQVLVYYRIHRYASMTKLKKRIDYADWVTFNIQQRRKGRQELSFHEFKSYLNKRPLLYKIGRLRKHNGKHLYRTAGLMYGNKMKFNFIIYLILSFLLRPFYVTDKLRKQVFD